ncbi:MAG: oxygen-independent coproporphyrinogen III oxidase [Caulobacterales bacterium]
MTFACDTAMRLRRIALLPRYGGRAPRYTSYPTAAQFTPAVDASTYADWLGELPAERSVSLYVHVPFCARLCWYCGCNTRVIHRGESMSGYVGLLTQEMALVERRLPARLKVDALHLGGGTPNMLGVDDLAVMFGALRQVFRFAPDAEIAAEIDPSQLRPEWVRAAAYHGLSRASLGVQDLSPDVQAAVNRNEPFEVVARAARLLREAGVVSLNLDLMYGLPRQREADVIATLDQVLALKPDRLALFGYAHVPWMKAHQKLINEADLPDEAERLDQCEAAAQRLASEGYVRIGLDHYARPDDSLAMALTEGRLHRNFQGYTTDEAETLIGFGVSSIGRLPQGYVQNEPTELAWRKRVAAGELPTARGVLVTGEDAFRGEIIEALMCGFSADLGAIRRRHGRGPESLAGATSFLAALERDGLVERRDEAVRVTPLGRPFVRSVCAAFDAHLDAGALRHSIAV